MKDHRGKLIAEINVTPFVDVMLVLLVIFMITAPLMFSGIKLQLPKTKKVSRLQLNSSQVIISISQSGEIYLGKEKFLLEEIAGEVTARMKKFQQDTVFIRAHWEIAYGKVVALMAYLKSKNITNISLVTEDDTKK